MLQKLISALCKAKGEFEPIKKDKVNKFFNNAKYSSLDAVIDAVTPALSDNGLTVIQTGEMSEDGYILVTHLFHESGETISSSFPIPNVNKPQELGSALTYIRRYALCAILGVASDEDDDGNNSSVTQPSNQQKQQARKVVSPSPQREQPKPQKPVEPEPEVVLDVSTHPLMVKFAESMGVVDSVEKVSVLINWLNAPKQWDAVKDLDGVAEYVATLETEALERLSEPSEVVEPEPVAVAAATNGKAPKRRNPPAKTIEVDDGEF